VRSLVALTSSLATNGLRPMLARGIALTLDARSPDQYRSPVTKADLIAVIAHRLRLPHPRAELLVDQVFSSMSDALMRGEGIEIRGFGSFTVRKYGAYDGRNPRTGDIVRVKPKRLPFFKVGKKLCEKVDRACCIRQVCTEPWSAGTFPF
jgi:nucleoid DNA-binding protein